MSPIVSNGLSRFLLFLLAPLFFTAAVRAQEKPLKGNIHPNTKLMQDRGALEPSALIYNIRLVLKPSDEQAAALFLLLEEQRDPSSFNYHNWLTPEQYGERFGVNETDLAQVSSWLQSQGFAVDQIARARNWITFTGTAGQIERSFHTELHRYETDGETHFANATDPSVPGSFADLIDTIRGLDDFRPKPHRTRLLNPSYNGMGGAHFLAPDDLAAIYNISPLYKAGFDGSGEKLVIAGQTDINLSDLRAFRAEFNLPALDPQLVLFGTDPGISQGDQIEADLDLEWAGAVARNATVIYVYSNNAFESVQYAIDQNLAPVISLSYGTCEADAPASLRLLAQQANAQGITWMTSSGDSGAAGCDWNVSAASHGPTVSFPANLPEVTAVGGTEFSESASTGWSAQNGLNGQSATGYLTEKSWNDTALGYGISASGGGPSSKFAKPWWQSGPGVPDDHARDVPDISLAASGDHDGYLIFAGGKQMVVGGTSASAPAFAGIVTLLNQYLVAKGVQPKAGLGNINPNLYSLAQTATGVIHDVTLGDNIVPCATGSTGCASGSFGYKAGPGYDLVTGLGSVDANKLVTRWASLPSAIGTTMTLSPGPATVAQTGTVQLTATISPVTGNNPPTGSVTFFAGATNLGSAAAVTSGTHATAALSLKANNLSVGANTITASYAATGNFSNATASAPLTVTAVPAATATLMTIQASPASLTQNGSTLLTVSIKPASGTVPPQGSIKFSLGNVSLGSAPARPAGQTATGSLTVDAGKLALGANIITATYAPTGSFTASTGTVTVTVVANPPLTTTTAVLTANPPMIAPSATTRLIAMVKTAANAAQLSGTVTFSTAGTTLGSAALVTSGGIATATLTIPASSLSIGNNTISATYSGNGTSTASTAAAKVTVANRLSSPQRR